VPVRRIGRHRSYVGELHAFGLGKERNDDDGDQHRALQQNRKYERAAASPAFVYALFPVAFNQTACEYAKIFFRVSPVLDGHHTPPEKILQA
jgi:hypothetical protein